MMQLIITIVVNSAAKKPENAVWEQALLDRVLQEALLHAGYGDSTITIEVEQ